MPDLVRLIESAMPSTPLNGNPVLDFGIDRSSIRFTGEGLQRPECILAEPDGVIWSADARGGVVRIAPDSSQQIITQQRSEHFHDANSESTRYLGRAPQRARIDGMVIS